MDASNQMLMAAIEHPTLRQVVEYWLARRGERVAPLRADIDPIDLQPEIVSIR
jgi:hypothetical protein